MNQELLNIIYTAVGTLLTGLIGYGFMLLRAYTIPKIRNEELQEVARISIDVVQAVTLDVGENFVKELKKDGKLSKEDAISALELTKAKAKAMISERGKYLIEKHFGNFDAWLESQIEAFLAH